MVCKRAVEPSGKGYIDHGLMARLFREAPVNSIWKDLGNVMCLDLLCAIARASEAFIALRDELAADTAGGPRQLAELDELRQITWKACGVAGMAARACGVGASIHFPE